MLRYFTDFAEAFGSAWNRFWFTPADPLPCAVLRMAVGLLAMAHFLTLAIDLPRWYGPEGILPPATVRTLVEVRLPDGSVEPLYRLSYLNYLTTPGQLWLVHALAIVAAAAFAAGIVTRASGVLTAAALLAYVHRAPMITSHLEPVLVFLLLYLCVAPSGAWLSVDRWFARRREPGMATSAEPSLWANLGLRLIQVHLAMFYLMMGLTKLNGDGWWDGIAIWHLLAQTDSRPLDLTFLRASEYTINFWTHAIVYYELAFPVLVWNRWSRPLVLGLGLVIWLSLILATGLALFGLTMLVASAAFAPPAWYRALLSRGSPAVLPAKPAVAI